MKTKKCKNNGNELREIVEILALGITNLMRVLNMKVISKIDRKNFNCDCKIHYEKDKSKK